MMKNMHDGEVKNVAVKLLITTFVALSNEDAFEELQETAYLNLVHMLKDGDISLVDAMRINENVTSIL